MGGAKGVLAIVLVVMVITMTTGCGGPQFDDGEAIAIVHESLPKYYEKKSSSSASIATGCKTLLVFEEGSGFDVSSVGVLRLSEKYIGNGTWEVNLNSGQNLFKEGSVWASWKVYENSLEVLPDEDAQNTCY